MIPGFPRSRGGEIGTGGDVLPLEWTGASQERAFHGAPRGPRSTCAMPLSAA